ncbi:hypothetical protein I5J85_07395 [Pseudomonas aeruginosa]|jgi:hypothetical protein|nr:hypothetical protein [Pseudomonas aeruginosa]MBH8796962.1 hypothetical protein [Pseudomonas aeruginosa]MBH8804358.1 hypothetical protein [Pseudomonas aeruginosa]QYG43647.1 hypothetical protein J5V74_29670 [Pseudomonas aeruginosa]
MHFSRLRIPLAITAALGMLSGCSSKEPAPEPFTGTPFEVQQYEPDLREHHTSWGHSGRGGAALRKPSYQPVLGSPDVLETRAGKLHPELQNTAKGVTASIAVPPALRSGTCLDQPEENQTPDHVRVMTPSGPADATQIVTLANSTGSVSDYIRVRNKLCSGAERLTYEEWEVLVHGTPKDVPLRLQPTFNSLAK